MSRVAVDLEQLADLIDEMERTQAQLTRVRDDVATRVAQMHLTWRGSAAVAQDEAQRRWTAGAGEVQEALAALRAIVRTAHGNCHAAAAANRRMWAL